MTAILHPCSQQVGKSSLLDINAPTCGKPAVHVCRQGKYLFASCDEHPCPWCENGSQEAGS